MKKREREKDFRVKIISAVLLVLIILVFLIGFNWNKISGRAIGVSSEDEEAIAGGVIQSAVKPVDGIKLSVATLKDEYKVKEKILLTDPPDENIISGNVVSDGVLGSSFNNQIINNYDNILNSNQMIRKVIDRNGNIALENEEIKSKGYIIEFEDKPLVLKEKELAEKKAASSGAASVAGLSASSKAQIKTTMNQERAKLRSKKERIKNDMREKLIPGFHSEKPDLWKNIFRLITGRTVSNPSPSVDLKILGEYENVFNGIALDITAEEAEKVKTVPGVKSVSPNLEVHTMMMDSVPLIGADKVWQLDADGNDCATSGKECLTGKGIKIAIIDTGIDYTHADLGGCTREEFVAGNCEKVIGGYDFSDNDHDPMDYQGHGTHVAGIAAGSGAGGLRGVAPDAKLYAYKVFPNSYEHVIIAAIERAVDPNNDKDFSDKVDIISMSLGGQGDPSDPMSTEVDNVVNAGVVVVIAAGNSGPSPETIMSPGSARKAITVGASYKKDYPEGFGKDSSPKIDEVTYFSSRGPVGGLIKPDIVAPGALICSARYDSIYPEGAHRYYKPCLDERHVQIAGTSMAAPIVSGVVALLKQKHPDWSPEEIKQALKNTATDLGFDINIQGSGRINIFDAINSNKPVIARLDTFGFVNENINIIGTASGEGFNNYVVEYGKGLNPTEWISICSFDTPKTNDILCSNVDKNMFYEGSNVLRLKVNFNGGVSEDKSVIYLMNEMQEGWPKKLDGVIFSMIVEDLDNDGNNEIIATTRSSTYLFDIRGNILPGWPKKHNLICSGPCSACAAIGNFDNDNEKEVVVSSIQEVAIYKKDGKQVQGWPKKLDRIYSTCPTIGDIDNNGNDDIVLSSSLSFGEIDNSKVYAFNKDGSFIEGWPITIDSVVKGTASLSDINKDGFKEIIIGGIFDNKLYVFDQNGRNLAGWPIPLGSSADASSYSSPIVADLDDDGNNEIIAAGSVYLYVLNSDGTIRDGWPVRIGTSIDATPSVGDVNGDGNLEIIYSASNGNRAYIYSKEGNILKQLYIPSGGLINIDGNIASSIVIGDINWDNILDIIQAPHTKRGEIYAWNFNGETFLDATLGWPKYYYDGSITGPIATPVLSDIDKDEDVEVLLGSRGGSLFIWDLNAAYKPNTMVWPTFQHDFQHTGFYINNPICSQDADCNDNNPKTEDKCINPGTVNSACQNMQIICISNSECGTNGFIGNPICQSNDVYQNFITYTCNNPGIAPGIAQSSCSSSTSLKLKQDCDFKCIDGSCLKRPQSKLVNTNTKAVSGTLYMHLQKKDKKGKWVNVKKAIDRKITIPGKGLVKLDNGKDRNGKQRFKGWNNLNVFAKAKGDYRVYTVLVVGNKKITGSWKFEVA